MLSHREEVEKYLGVIKIFSLWFSACCFISVKLHIFLALFIYVVYIADVPQRATRKQGKTGRRTETSLSSAQQRFHHYYLIKTITFCPHKLVLALTLTRVSRKPLNEHHQAMAAGNKTSLEERLGK